jgi:hypothetical protein
MVFDIPSGMIRFPYISRPWSLELDGIYQEKYSDVRDCNCDTWIHAMSKLKRHKAAVYVYVKFAPIISKDVSRIICKMVKAIPSSEWKVKPDDIPFKYTHNNSSWTYIADKTDPDFIAARKATLMLARAEEDCNIFKDDFEALRKKQKRKELWKEKAELLQKIFNKSQNF